jgi:hypothetical protein
MDSGVVFPLPLLAVGSQLLILVVSVLLAPMTFLALFLFVDVLRLAGAWDYKRVIAALWYVFISSCTAIPTIGLPFVFLDSGLGFPFSILDALCFLLAFIGPLFISPGGSVALFEVSEFECYPSFGSGEGDSTRPVRAIWAFSSFIINLIICTL